LRAYTCSLLVLGKPKNYSKFEKNEPNQNAFTGKIYDGVKRKKNFTSSCSSKHEVVCLW